MRAIIQCDCGNDSFIETKIVGPRRLLLYKRNNLHQQMPYAEQPLDIYKYFCSKCGAELKEET